MMRRSRWESEARQGVCMDAFLRAEGHAFFFFFFISLLDGEGEGGASEPAGLDR